MDLIQAYHHDQSWDLINTATTTTTTATSAAAVVGSANDDGEEMRSVEAYPEWMLDEVARQLSEEDRSQQSMFFLPQEQDHQNSFHFLSSNGQIYRPQNLSINPQNQDQEMIIQDDVHELGLLKLLLECAAAISVDNLAEANSMLMELVQLSSPYAASCAERLVAHFAKAMASRVMSSWLGISAPLTPPSSIFSHFNTFNTIAPFVKFAHFTCNQAILEAVHGKDRLHIIDLDIMQGLQWPALFHVLATRVEGPPAMVRVTGMGPSMEVLHETGRRLSEFAKRLGLPMEFNPVAKRAGDVEDVGGMVRRRRGEAVVVQWLHHSLYDAGGPDWKTMRLLQAAAPTVVTLVEQETGAHSSSSFLDRFVGALHYYSAMFDAVGAAPCVDGAREEVEEGVLGKEVGNIVAVGGPGRRGEEKCTGRWREEMRRSGFVKVGMSCNAMAQAEMILNLLPPASGYTVMHGDGMVRLGWKDVGLYTVSSWTWPSI